MALPAPESVSVLKVKFTEEISPVWGPQVLSLECSLTDPQPLALAPQRLWEADSPSSRGLLLLSDFT